MNTFNHDAGAMTAADQEIDQTLARAIRLEPLGEGFDAAVLARVDSLQQAAAQRAAGLDATQRAATLDPTRAVLEQEQRAMRVRVAIYSTAAALLLAVLIHAVGLISGPLLDRLGPLPIVLGDPRAWALPSAALAVLVSGAWMFARDRHLGVL